MNDAADPPFWRVKSLEEMSEPEWESLCDGCGRCCLVKLEDEDTGEVHYTEIGCKLLDGRTCKCRDYVNRQAEVADCVKLTPMTVRGLSWLPATCAYRRVNEGLGLAWWHPLVSGRAETVAEAGVSARGKIFASESDLDPERWLDHIVKWPNRPARAKKPG